MKIVIEDLIKSFILDCKIDRDSEVLKNVCKIKII